MLKYGAGGHAFVPANTLLSIDIRFPDLGTKGKESRKDEKVPRRSSVI